MVRRVGIDELIDYARIRNNRTNHIAGLVPIFVEVLPAVVDQLKKRILSAISSFEDEILDFTRALVAVPTENPPGKSYPDCIKIIGNELQKVGLEFTVIEVPVTREQATETSVGRQTPYPRYCLLSYYGPGEKTVYFHGHYDVVPAARESQFQPQIKGGCLYGRGSSDMKSGLAAMIYAVKAIKECGFELDGRIGLTIVPDEETGGEQGSRYLLQRGLLGKDGIAALTPEPTGGVIWNANRGAISLRVTVKGKAAHVCLQHQAVNAFEQMHTVVDELLKLKAEVESRKTDFNIEPDATRQSILMLGGLCGGGTNFNTVPAECSFTIDRRINPEEDLKTEKQRLFAIFDRFRQDGIDLHVEILQEGNSEGCSESDPVAQGLARSIKSITDKQPSFEMCPGLLETRFYAQQGIPAFGYGPGILSVSHGPDEFVRIADIYNCAAVYALTAVELLTS